MSSNITPRLTVRLSAVALAVGAAFPHAPLHAQQLSLPAADSRRDPFSNPSPAATTGAAAMPPPSNLLTALGASGHSTTLDNTFDGKRLLLSPEYSDQTGLSLGGAFAFPLGDTAAAGIVVTAGSKKKELLLNTGVELGNTQRVVFTLGQLRQYLSIGFASGAEKTEMTQTSGAVSYQHFLGQGLLNSYEVNGYLANTPSRDLDDKTYARDTATLYELWNDPRRVAGGRVTGLQGRLMLSPFSGSTLKLGGGGERLEYDYLTGKQGISRPTASVEWNQQLAAGLSLKAGADRAAAQDRYSLGIEHDYGGGWKLGLGTTTIRGRDGAPEDRQIKLTLSVDFSGKSSRSNFGTGHSAAPTWGKLLDQVAVRPAFLPSQVVAKLDTTATPTRLIAVNKGSLPAGSSIDTLTGNITTPLGVSVTGIAGVTKNLAAFTNAGQFSVSGTNLVINTSLITQPAAGVSDSYVVTANNLGGGTTLITISVSRGSVKIDSITVGAGAADTTPPTTTSAPAISVAAAATTVSVTQTINEAGTGYYLLQAAAAAAPTVAAVKAGTSFAMSAATPAVVSLTGLTPSTAYKYYFVAKDSANNDQAAVSTGLAITTTALAVPASFAHTNDSGSSNSDGFTNLQPAASWMVVAGATSYELSTNSGTSWTDVGNVTSGQFGAGAFPAVLTNGNTYGLQVRAKAAGVSGPATGTTSVTFDTTAPSKTGESLVALDTGGGTGGGTGSGTLTFGEAVQSVTSISFKKTADNSNAAGSISVTGGLTTTTLTVNWTAPNLAGEQVYIQLVVVDKAGNSRTVSTNNYDLF